MEAVSVTGALTKACNVPHYGVGQTAFSIIIFITFSFSISEHSRDKGPSRISSLGRMTFQSVS